MRRELANEWKGETFFCRVNGSLKQLNLNENSVDTFNIKLQMERRKESAFRNQGWVNFHEIRIKQLIEVSVQDPNHPTHLPLPPPPPPPIRIWTARVSRQPVPGAPNLIYLSFHLIYSFNIFIYFCTVVAGTDFKSACVSIWQRVCLSICRTIWFVF